MIPPLGRGDIAVFSQCSCQRYSIFWQILFFRFYYRQTFDTLCKVCHRDDSVSIGHGFFWWKSVQSIGESVITDVHISSDSINNLSFDVGRSYTVQDEIIWSQSKPIAHASSTVNSFLIPLPTQIID